MAKNTISLITGIGGFVASHLARYLLEQGEEVYGTYRWNEDLSRIKDIKDKIHMIPMDLLDMKSCIKAIRIANPNYIFHLAAQSYVSDSFEYPEVTIQTNMIGTYHILEAVRGLKDVARYMNSASTFNPVIHVCSSSEVYGQVTPDEVPIKETNQFRPANPYAVSKVGADMIAYQYWTSFGLKIIRTRMFTHVGDGRTMDSAENAFAKQIVRIELGLQSPVVYHGNLNSVRTWADVRDAVEAYHVLVRKCTPGEVYNIGGTTTKTIGEMLDYLISISTCKKITKKLNTELLRPSDVTLQIPDCSKFIKQTGWAPKYTFEETISSILNGWRRRENV